MPKTDTLASFIVEVFGLVGAIAHGQKGEPMAMAEIKVPIQVNLPDDWMEQIVNRLRNDPEAEWVEIVRCKDCKFYTPMNRETQTGICRLLMHQNFGDDWYCAGAERRTDES
jgi:hypothetical protein